MSKPSFLLFSFFFSFFLFFLGLTSAIGRADVSSECGLRVGRSAARVTHGSRRVVQRTKNTPEASPARAAFSGGEISGVDSS